MIYCVIPPELKDELYDRLVEYYKDNPNVEVIVDRRTGPDRRQGGQLLEMKERGRCATAAAGASRGPSRSRTLPEGVGPSNVAPAGLAAPR